MSTPLLPPHLLTMPDLPAREDQSKRHQHLIAAWITVRKIAEHRRDPEEYLAGADAALTFAELGSKRWRERWNPHFIVHNTLRNLREEFDLYEKTTQKQLTELREERTKLQRKLGVLQTELDKEKKISLHLPKVSALPSTTTPNPHRAQVENQRRTLEMLQRVLNSRSRYTRQEDLTLERLRKLITQPSEELREAVTAVKDQYPVILELFKNWNTVSGSLQWLVENRDDSVLEPLAHVTSD